MFYLISVFAIITQGVYSVLIYDTTIVEVSQFGRIHQELQLQYINMFEVPTSWKQSCESQSRTDTNYNQRCDILVYGIFCNVLKGIIHQNYNLFTINDDTNPKSRTHKYPELSCGNVTRYFVGSQKDFENYWGTEFPVIAKYSSRTFKKWYIWKIEVAEWNYHGMPFKIWFEVLKSSSKPITKSYNSVYDFQHELRAYYKLVYWTIGKCDADNYGSTCWFECKDNARRICNCEIEKNFTTINCNPNCQAGWFPTFIIYDLGYIVHPMTDCIMRDICTYSSVCKDKECFQMTNTTYACYYILPIITVENIDGNYTGDVILYNDTISINISLSSIDNINLHINYTIKLSRDSFIFMQKVFEYIDGYSIPYFKVIDDNFIDKICELQITFYYFAWMKTITRLKKFRIYVKPYHINIISVDLRRPVKRYVYLGEDLLCNSSSKPDYRTIEQWKSSIKFFFHFGADQKIPSDTSLGSHIINCQLELVIFGRPNSKNELHIKLYMRPYASFGWNITENILIKDDKPLCNSVAFIEFKITIYQIKGKDSLTFKNNLIQLNDTRGDFYEVVCSWDNGGYIHDIRTLTFNLRTQMSFGCFFLHPNIPGAIIQCGHNGYFYDDYRIIVKVFIIMEVGLKIIQSDNYLRIPYAVESRYLILQCKIKSKKFKMNDLVLNKSIKFSEKIRGSYSFTDESKVCSQYTNYVEEQEVIVVNPTTVEINHIFFYFSLPNDALSYLLFLLFLQIIFPLIFSIIFFRLLTKTTKVKSYPKTTTDILKKMTRRRIIDSLSHISNTLIDVPRYDNINLLTFMDDELSSPDLAHI